MFHKGTIGMLAVVLAGCGGQGGGPPAGEWPVTVDLVPVRVETVREVVSAVGTLAAEEEVEVSPVVAGMVEEILFEEGQRVVVGAPLVVLDRRKQEARLREVEAGVTLARQRFERAKALLAEQTVAKEEFEAAEAQMAVAEAMLTLERERLKELTVEAPFAGVLSRRRVSVGQYLNVGSPVVTLLAVDRLKLWFSVPERYAGRLREGQLVELTVSPHPGRVFAGRVSFVDPKVEEGTRTVGVMAEVDNRAGELKPGLFANVRVVVGERSMALTVPEEAVFLIGEDSIVFVAEEGRASSRKIREGIRLEGRVEVLEGLGAGDRVVLGDSRKLVDGSLLNVRRELPVGGAGAVAVGAVLGTSP